MIAWRPGRYAVVGAICALAHNAIMIFGDWCGFNYVPMTFVSFFLVTPLGYWLHSGYTFHGPFSLRGFLRFASGVATGFPLSLASMALLCSVLRLPVIVAAPIATGMLFVWNYVCAHWAILGRLRIR